MVSASRAGLSNKNQCGAQGVHGVGGSKGAVRGSFRGPDCPNSVEAAPWKQEGSRQADLEEGCTCSAKKTPSEDKRSSLVNGFCRGSIPVATRVRDMEGARRAVHRAAAGREADRESPKDRSEAQPVMARPLARPITCASRAEEKKVCKRWHGEGSRPSLSYFRNRSAPPRRPGTSSAG
jgi:hypothetical protein